MRLFAASLLHETNRFSPLPTNLDSFRESLLYVPSTGEGAHHLAGELEGLNLKLFLESQGHEVVHGLAASAQPSGPLARKDYEFLRDELLANLKAALPVDAVLLFLHGAMVAEAYDDCEGDVLARVRALVGPSVVVGVELDLHGNFTRAMADAATILVSCKEYPHIDFPDRARDLLRLMERTVTRDIRPTTALVRVPMLGTYPTTRQPMRGFVDEIMAIEEAGKALSISLGHGFAWNDGPNLGGSVIVITDNDAAGARRLADDIATRYFAMRREILEPRKTIDEALNLAQASTGRPIVIADTTDNPGAGAAGDSTFLLRAIRERGMRDVALAMLWDPMAVQSAMRAGIGASVPLRIGGKTGPFSGDPLDVVARVTALNEHGSQLAQGMRVPFGPAAAIEFDGIEVVINTLRNQTFSPECFTGLGIDPRSKRYVIVKSQQHFHETFAPVASAIIYASPPGTVNMNARELPLTRAPRPVWPLDATPFSAHGRDWY